MSELKVNCLRCDNQLKLFPSDAHGSFYYCPGCGTMQLVADATAIAAMQEQMAELEELLESLAIRSEGMCICEELRALESEQRKDGPK
jgi:late competence protein required for DNA uptake (superfamily II DNA/RNA helicase)